MSKKKTNRKKNRKKRNRSEEQVKQRPKVSERARFLEGLNSGMALKLLNRPSLQFYNPENGEPRKEDIEPPMILYVDMDPEPGSKNAILYDLTNEVVRVFSILEDNNDIELLLRKLQPKVLRTINSFIPLMSEIKDSPVVVDIIVEDDFFPTSAFSVYKDFQDNYQWIGPHMEPPVLGEMIFPIVRVSSVDNDFLAERDLNRMIDNMLYLSEDSKKQALN